MMFPFFTTWTQEIESKKSWVRKLMDKLIRRRLISAEDIRVAMVTTPEGLREIAVGLLTAASHAEVAGIGHYAPIWPIRFIASDVDTAREIHNNLMAINWRPSGRNIDHEGNIKPSGEVRWPAYLEHANVTVRGSEMVYLLRYYTRG